MTTVPVKVDAPALNLSDTQVPGYLTVASGQSTASFESARASRIHLVLVYSQSHPITVTETNGFTTLSSGTVDMGSNGTYRSLVLHANAEDVTFPIQIPVTVPTGGWVKGIAVLLQNAGTPAEVLGTSLGNYDLNVIEDKQINTSGASSDVPFRTVTYMLLAKSVNTTPWLGSLTSGVSGFSSIGPFQVPGGTIYLMLCVTPTPEVYQPNTSYSRTYYFDGGNFLEGHMMFVRVPEDYPPLCSDPEHVPVTITITAHGPVDVQVD